ncbi:MAG: hypothetical protein WBW34_13220 [Nitrososphaeraceae archaeon]
MVILEFQFDSFRIIEISLSVLVITVILVLRKKRIQAKLQGGEGQKEENKKIIMQT